MIRALIVDDEVQAVKSLRKMLQWYCAESVEVVGAAANPTEAWPLVEAERPALIFLDVEMGKENGFMLLEKVRAHFPDTGIIFTTAHSEYAISALRKDAVDYLLKPVEGEALQAAVRRFQEKRAEGRSKNAAEERVAQIALPLRDQVRVIPLDEIIRCESDRNYTRFHLVDGTQYLISRTMGSFMPEFEGHRFFRSHKSHVVNLAHLKSYVRQEGGYLLMKDGSQVPLSRTQRLALFDLLGI